MLMDIKALLARSAYTLAITLTIFITITSLVSLKIMKSISIGISNFDKIVHFALHFLLALSWFFATQKNIVKRKTKTILIIGLISYGIIIEALQDGMTTHRQADFYDILANSIGVLLAAILFPRLNRWFNSI